MGGWLFETVMMILFAVNLLIKCTLLFSFCNFNCHEVRFCCHEIQFWCINKKSSRQGEDLANFDWIDEIG
jgi:hypothetical protein